MNSFWLIDHYIFANDFLRFFDRSLKKRKKSCFLKSEKKRKIRILEHCNERCRNRRRFITRRRIHIQAYDLAEVRIHGSYFSSWGAALQTRWSQTAGSATLVEQYRLWPPISAAAAAAAVHGIIGDDVSLYLRCISVHVEWVTIS